MRQASAVGLTILIALSGCMAGEDEVPAGPVAEPDGALLAELQELATFPEVRFETDLGTVRMILYQDWLPRTSNHIAGLVERGFYDNTIIHRVVDDFVIQGGDPTGTGEGGSGPGGLSTEPVPLEIRDGLQFGSGAVGLARWTDDTGDSQWFIAEKPALHLNDPQGTTGDVFGAYALFAQVFEGLDVVRAIASVETLPNDRPVDDVALQSAELLDPPAIDLIGLIPAVHADFQFAIIGPAQLELPRHLVAGHPFTVRASADSACDVADMTFVGPLDQPVVLAPVAGDPCTLEAVVTLPAGTYGVVGGSPGQFEPAFRVTVLPWHDAYAPFAGAP